MIGGFNANLGAFEELGFVYRLRSYGRGKGLRYPVVRQHRGATSARIKGGMFTMGVSYIVAIVIFVSNALLPKRLQIRNGGKRMSFWYGPKC